METVVAVASATGVVEVIVVATGVSSGVVIIIATIVTIIRIMFMLSWWQ